MSAAKKAAAVLSRTEKTDLRHARIIEAAAGCFVAQGFHQTSMRDIAAAAEVSLGNLYNHFADKSALIAEIAALEVAELQPLLAQMRRTTAADRAIANFVSGYLDLMAEPGYVALAVEIVAEAARNPVIAARFAASRRLLVDALVETLGRGVEQQSIATDLSRNEAAELIIDATEGLAFRTILTRVKPSKAARDGLQLMLRKYLRPEAATRSSRRH
jgi:AcrR family transcriptional regulator